MFHQTIIGKPKCCLNRNCKTQFTKSSHLGWLPKSEVEVYAIMRCLKCKDTFAIIQLMSMAHEYRDNLPKDKDKNLALLFSVLRFGSTGFSVWFFGFISM